MSKLSELALELATKYHEGQFRNDGTTPYITHPIAVAHRFAPEQEKHRAVAYLHDVIEDCNVTADDLNKAGIPEDVVLAVLLLTRNKDKDYLDTILEIVPNDLARAVKISDIEHNLLTVTNRDKRDKYRLAVWILKSKETPSS